MYSVYLVFTQELVSEILILEANLFIYLYETSINSMCGGCTACFWCWQIN